MVRRTKISLLTLFLVVVAQGLWAQSVLPTVGERIFVKGGVAEAVVENRAGVNLAAMTPDSLLHYMAAVDSLRGDGAGYDRARVDSLVDAMLDRTPPTADSLSADDLAKLLAERRGRTLNSATVRYFMDDAEFLDRYVGGGVDTLLPKLALYDTVGLSKREKRRLARADTTAYRYNKYFRDSIPLSRMVVASIVAPGFSQFYNQQYWKIPVLYGGVAAGIGLGMWQNSKYKPYRRLYDFYEARKPQSYGNGDLTFATRQAAYEQTLTELQGGMIRHNTFRQMAFGFAAATYIYFLIDGALNYPSKVNDVKKATTLATVCPGAGQIYNKQFWKLPIVIGGGAALVYCIDFNNRGYQRFLKAYNQRMDPDPNVVDEFVQPDGSFRVSVDQIVNYKNNYRRNRDLCIILTGLFYVVQIIDAHAAAHMKTYDVSDDLAAVSFEPVIDNFWSHAVGSSVNTFGFSLNFKF
ncbi:MAG: DUF5683 domain-containing protein [Rikenellaceae bacterium]|jgi:hypothetical protein|nr:DUF5683 domain-containing protein [Rikenellaceae bacterium]